MDPTPSPRPAALVIEAMAAALVPAVNPSHRPYSQMSPQLRREWDRKIESTLDAAHLAGFVLIPRAELEEAAGYVEAFATIEREGLGMTVRSGEMFKCAASLRQRSRG